MALKSYNPTSPGIRFRTGFSFDEITKTKPEKGLTEPIKKTGGRDNRGRITVRFMGGGHKRRYRSVDFRRDKTGVPAKVAAIEYDPNRSARLALLHYADGEKRYIIAPQALQVGVMVSAGNDAEVKPGNAMEIAAVPLGTFIYNVELVPGKGGQIARGAGTFCQLMAKEGDHAVLRLPSSEMRKVPLRSYCTIGQVGNEDHQNIVIGKAGKSRWLGRRPNVRGVAMNPVDHPMGGGEGKSSGGRHPCSPWGQLSKGKKTRKTKLSDA
ncbi:MAG TPA: 50S ribosomal protein L2, partial [Vicinamibacteria bacterium]|nr:50S ribosomal protein L2 [Vicinamibacteria bacterium]